jgi:hypothetical protein
MYTREEHSPYTIDLSPHPAGIYVVRAVFPNQVLVKKIIKN